MMGRNRDQRRVYRALILLLLLGMGLSSPSQASDLQTIQHRGFLRVGVKNNLPLLGQSDASGQRSGFEIELAQKLTQTIWGDRVQVEYHPLLNQHRLHAVATGTVDIAIANIHITESRRRLVDFSHPYLTSWTTLIHLTSTSQINPNASTIGMLQGSVAIGRIQARFPHAQLIGLKDYAEGKAQLKDGTIQFFAGDRIALKSWPQADFQTTTQRMGLSHLAIAMPKGLQHRDLHDAINLALQSLEESGQLQQMRNKWHLSETEGTAVDRLEPESTDRQIPLDPSF